MFETVKELILEFAEPDFEITPETKLRNDLGLTSFDLVCLADRLSSMLETQLTDKQMRMCVTVSDLCALGETK